MNKIFRIISVLLASMPLGFYAHGGSIVAFPTGNASWIVMSEVSGSTKGVPTPNVEKAEVTQVNDVKKIELTWSDGKTTEKWTIPRLPVEFEQDPRDGRVSSFQNGGMHQILTKFFQSYDSFAFDWVSPTTLQEKEPVTYKGKQCFHYLSTATAPDSGISFKREAWIDATTSLPVAYDNGAFLSTYTFAPKPPTGPLEFPPAFKTSIHYYKASMGYR
jgi:hypothetical protein